MYSCVYCGAPLDDDSQFCANCGKKIKLCPRCGTVLKDGSLFCAKCGTRLDEQNVPVIKSPQVAYPVTSQQEEAVVVDEWEEENNKKWWYLIGGIAVFIILTVSWYGYNQFYKYTHIDVHELLSELQLPKEYYHSAKEIVEKPDFDLNYYQDNQKYALRGWIVYNKKYGNEIIFNNKSFNSDKDDIEEFYWVIGHIFDCWNTSPAVAEWLSMRYSSFESVNGKSSFYYTSNKSKGIQFVTLGKCDNEGNLLFKSVDNKYEANFKQVHLSTVITGLK